MERGRRKRPHLPSPTTPAPTGEKTYPCNDLKGPAPHARAVHKGDRKGPCSPPHYPRQHRDTERFRRQDLLRCFLQTRAHESLRAFVAASSRLVEGQAQGPHHSSLPRPVPTVQKTASLKKPTCVSPARVAPTMIRIALPGRVMIGAPLAVAPACCLSWSCGVVREPRMMFQGHTSLAPTGRVFHPGG